MRKLKNSFTSGHDQIPSFLVKDCKYIFSRPLTKIFNLAISSSIFPDVWKIAKVTPIFKTGINSDICNYRPISILSNFSKVFEQCIHSRLYPLIAIHLSPCQHGFISNRSTTSNLVSFTQYLGEVLDTGGQVDVVYTDFAKAFDRLDHSVLPFKFDSFGFSNELIQFFTSYLNNRPHFVSYNGYTSTRYLATSGIPQGSNLGPLIFNMFVNDLPNVIGCRKLLFADDLKLYTCISSTDDCFNLQHDLVNIWNWCAQNNLSLNIAKCKIISFTRTLKPFIFHYNLNGSIIDRTTTIKDLGVLFDAKLTFREHINSVCSAARSTLGFIIRNCNAFTNITALKSLYFSLIRSRLEYGAIVWDPFYLIYRRELELVQRKFLKFLAYRLDGTYPNRGIDQSVLLTRFELTSLESRRIFSTVMFLYKLLHNKIDSPELLSRIAFKVPQFKSRNHSTFHLPPARTNLLIQSPIYRMCNFFNIISLSCDINHSSINTIRNAVLEAYPR